MQIIIAPFQAQIPSISASQDELALSCVDLCRSPKQSSLIHLICAGKHAEAKHRYLNLKEFNENTVRDVRNVTSCNQR
jgi:hypothetical protein